jgi:subtilisin family serine protease
MTRRTTPVRLLPSGILACLLVMSLQAIPAAADESIETPTITESLEATPTIETSQTHPTEESTGTPSATSTETETPVPGTGTAVVGTAKGTQTATPSITAAPLLGGNYISNEVLVRFKNSATDEMIAECLGRVNGRIDSLIEEISVSVLRIDSLSVSNAVATISACEGIRYVEPNYLAFSADTIPNDSGWANQYGLVNIRAPQGWDLVRGSSGIVIAIADTGVDLGHSDLSAKIVAGCYLGVFYLS